MASVNAGRSLDIGASDLGRVTLADGTYELIKTMILDHRIPANTRVSIDDISRQLGVSQTPVREALARLEADSLVIKVPLRGYETTQLLTLDEFRDLYRFRGVIEPWAAAQAATVAEPAEVDDLLAELARGEQIAAASDEGDYARFVEHDMRFHAGVAAMSHNRHVLDALVRARVHLHLLRAYQASRVTEDAVLAKLLADAYAGGPQGTSVREHHEIARAIADGDATRAHDLMVAHIDGSLDRLTAASESLD